MDEHEPSKLDATWGGVNVAVRGSIVVLAVLILANAGLTVWSLGDLTRTQHFDDVAAAHTAQADRTQTEVIAQTQRFAALETRLQAMQEAILEQGVQNRLAIKEVAKASLLTESQRVQVQKNLSAALRELLLESEANKQGR